MFLPNPVKLPCISDCQHSGENLSRYDNRRGMHHKARGSDNGSQYDRQMRWIFGSLGHGG
jgi:hypothetical protein